MWMEALLSVPVAPAVAGAGAGKLPSPYLVSPGPAPRAGHMEPHVPELLMPSWNIALPRLGSCWCSQTAQGRSSAAGVPQNRGSVASGLGGLRRHPRDLRVPQRCWPGTGGDNEGAQTW